MRTTATTGLAIGYRCHHRRIGYLLLHYFKIIIHVFVSNNTTSYQSDTVNVNKWGRRCWPFLCFIVIPSCLDKFDVIIMQNALEHERVYGKPVIEDACIDHRLELAVYLQNCTDCCLWVADLQCGTEGRGTLEGQRWIFTSTALLLHVGKSWKIESEREKYISASWALGQSI